MKPEIIKSDSEDVSSYLSDLGITKQELISYGCVNCIWRLHHMCAYSDNIPKVGICPEFVTFLMSLFKEGDSKNVLWENYNLYVLRLQSLEDYKMFVKFQEELISLESSGCKDKDKLQKIEIKRNTYKLWWSKLNEAVLKSLGRIVDREKRMTKDSQAKISVQQMNVMINKASDRLLDYDKKGNLIEGKKQ